MRRTLSAGLIFLLLLTAGGISAQQTDVVPSVAVDEAEPYEEDEFPLWMRTVRRAEIVAVGSFPFTMLASRLLYSIGRYAVFSLNAGESLPQYLPPLFAPQGAVPMTSTDNGIIVLGAVGLSLFIATVDFLLGLEPDAATP